MSHQEQVRAFADDIDKLVDRYVNEFDLLYADAIGVLFMKAQLICLQAKDDDSED